MSAPVTRDEAVARFAQQYVNWRTNESAAYRREVLADLDAAAAELHRTRPGDRHLTVEQYRASLARVLGLPHTEGRAA